MQALREHKRRQAEERIAAGPAWTNHDLVFTTTLGGPVNRNNLVKRNLRSALVKAEIGEWVGEGRKRRFIPKIRLYDLRHTCATLLLAAGINPKIVSERLGHASIVLTLDTYSHVLPTMQQDATDKLDSMLYG